MSDLRLRITGLQLLQYLSDIFLVEDLDCTFFLSDSVFMEMEGNKLKVYFPHAPTQELYMTEEECFVFVQAFLFLVFQERFAEQFAEAFCLLFFVHSGKETTGKDSDSFFANSDEVIEILGHVCEIE